MAETNKNLLSTLLKSKYILLFSVIIYSLLLYLYYYPETKLLFGDENRYLEQGLSISQGGEWHSHPFWPPMQSILIGIFATIFPHPILPLQIFQFILLVLAGFIVKDITYRETKHSMASQIALLVMLVYPSWLAYSQYLWPEVIHVFLLVSIIWVNAYKNHSYRWMFLSGLLLGLIILFKSLIILFVPILYLPLILHRNWKSNLKRIFLSVVVAMVTFAPASFKAHEMTGGWMVSNSSMFNLYLGLKTEKRQHFSQRIAGKHYNDYHKSADDFESRNHIVTEKAINKIEKDGYVNTVVYQLKKQYFRLFDYQSFFSQQFQGAVEENFVNKYSNHHDSFLVKILLIFNTVFYAVIMIGMLLGLMVSVKKSIIAQQFTLFLFYVLGLFLLLHVIPRFRIPLTPMMAFFSGYLFYYIQAKKHQGLMIFENSITWFVLFFISSLVLLLIFTASVLDKYFPL